MAEQHEQTPHSDTGPAATERAEALVNQLGERIGQYAALTNQQLQRWTARTREELEDIWAEAQSLRHRQTPPPAQA